MPDSSLLNDGAESGERPRPPLWATILWAVSPALVMLPWVLVAGRQAKGITWVAFVAGILNMYAFSAVMLWSRRVGHWEIRAVPLALLMLVLNMALVVAGDALLSALGLTAAPPQSPGP